MVRQLDAAVCHCTATTWPQAAANCDAVQHHTRSGQQDPEEECYHTGGRTQTTNDLRREWQNATNLRVSRTLVNGRLIRDG